MGYPAEFCVVVADPADWAAVHSPWGQIAAAWDMPTMGMREQRQATTGDSMASGSYATPLMLELADPSHVQVAQQTPERPTRQASLTVAVRDASPPLASAATNTASLACCTSV